MVAKRKRIIETLNSIVTLNNRYEYLAKEFIKLNSEKEYQAVRNFFLQTIEKLEEEKQHLPKGFRYTGTFYIKVPYSMPLEVEKINGSTFMREDLVSWQIESGVEDVSRYGYYRAIYKDKNTQKEITREDCEPVFEQKEYTCMEN